MLLGYGIMRAVKSNQINKVISNNLKKLYMQKIKHQKRFKKGDIILNFIGSRLHHGGCLCTRSWWGGNFNKEVKGEAVPHLEGKRQTSRSMNGKLIRLASK